MRAAYAFLGLSPPPASSPDQPTAEEEEERLRCRLKEIRVRFHPDKHPSATEADAALHRHIVHMAERATDRILSGKKNGRDESHVASDEDARERRRQRKRQLWEELEGIISSMREYRPPYEDDDDPIQMSSDPCDGEGEGARHSPSQTRRRPSP